MKENFSKVYGYNKDYIQSRFYISCDCGEELICFNLFKRDTEEKIEDKRYFVSFHGWSRLYGIFNKKYKRESFSLTQKSMEEFITSLEALDKTVITIETYYDKEYKKDYPSYITLEKDYFDYVICFYDCLKRYKKNKCCWSLIINNKEFPAIIKELKEMANAEWEKGKYWIE